MNGCCMADAEGFGHDQSCWWNNQRLRNKRRPIRRHLLPHAEFGDDPSGYCGCAGCDGMREDCNCPSCEAVRNGED